MRRAILLVLGLAAACGPSSESSDSGTEQEMCKSGGDVPPAPLRMGTFPNDTFVPLPENAPMTIYRGPQGGQHVLVSVELYATKGTSFVHEFSLKHAVRGTELGGRIVRGKTCTPGLSTIRDIPVFVNSATAAPARLQLRTMLLDDASATLETLQVEASLRLVP